MPMPRGDWPMTLLKGPAEGCLRIEVRAAPDEAEGAGGLLVDHVGACGGLEFAVATVTVGTLLTTDRFIERGGNFIDTANFYTGPSGNPIHPLEIPV